MNFDPTDDQLQQFLEVKTGRKGSKIDLDLTTDEQFYQAVYRELGTPPADRLSATFSQTVVQQLQHQQKRTHRMRSLETVGAVAVFLLFLASVWYFAPQLTQQQLLTSLLQASNWLLPAVAFVLLSQFLDYKLTQRLTRKLDRSN